MKTIFSQIRQFAMPHACATILIATALLFGFATNASALWPAGVYVFDALSGTVLDKETRKPIEGVVVVGHWGLEKKTLMNSGYSGPLVVKEVVTDKEGRFTIPASVATDIHKRGHFNSELYPEIAFFKREYDFTVYRHNGKRPISRFPEAYDTLKEDEYLMPKWLPDVKAQTERLRNTFFPLELIESPGTCLDYEKLLPYLLSALRIERDQIAKKDPQLSLIFAYAYSLKTMEICISNRMLKGQAK